MVYVYRVRRLVQVVLDETISSTDPLGEARNLPDLQHCLSEFQKLHERYTPQVARKMLAVATGKGYLYVTNQRTGTHQALQVKSEGIILLTGTGYLNALCGSVSKLLPVLSLAIALFAACVSVWAALYVSSR